MEHTYPLKEQRCGTCGKLLAKTGNYTALQIKCPRCGTLNHLKTESLEHSPASELPRATEPKLTNPGENIVKLSDEEIQDLMSLVGSIWTPAIAQNINYNTEVLVVINTALDELFKCSKILLDLLSTLADSAIGALFSLPWLIAKSASIAATLAQIQNNLQVRACINRIAAVYRTPLELASNGI